MRSQVIGRLSWGPGHLKSGRSPLSLRNFRACQCLSKAVPSEGGVSLSLFCREDEPLQGFDPVNRHAQAELVPLTQVILGEPVTLFSGA